MDKEATSNRANMLNPNHPSFWKSRGYSRRPDNWEAKVEARELLFPNMHQDKSKIIDKKDVGCQYEPPQNDQGVGIINNKKDNNSLGTIECMDTVANLDENDTETIAANDSRAQQ